MGHVDIFGDDRGHRHVGAGDQLISAGPQDRPHRPVEPLETPTLGQALGDQRIDVAPARIDAAHDIIEKIALGLVIAGVFDRRPQTVIVEFLDQARDRRPLHLMLVKRLDRGEARGGTRTGTGTSLGHAAGALAFVCPARKGASACATSSGASHGAKWPASGKRTTRKSSTSASRPSSWTGSKAGSFVPQMTRVGILTFAKAFKSQSGRGTGTTGGGTESLDPRYLLSIVVIAPV